MVKRRIHGDERTQRERVGGKIVGSVCKAQKCLRGGIVQAQDIHFIKEQKKNKEKEKEKERRKTRLNEKENIKKRY